MGVKPSLDQPIDSEHLSPGSVLEPFFSTESCPSSSADDSLGNDFLASKPPSLLNFQCCRFVLE